MMPGTILCPVCREATGVQSYFDDGKLIIHRCASCKVVFLNPSMPDVDYEDDYFSNPYYKNYKPDFNPNEHPVPLYNCILDVLGKWSNGGEMLEIGAGMGLFVKIALEKGYRAVGVDTSVHATEFAQKEMKVDVRKGFIQDMGFSDASFDSVVLNDVIEHVTDPHPLMETVSRLTKPGGILLMETPNEDSLINLVSRSIWKCTFGFVISPFKANHELEHRTYYNRKSMETLMQNHGFTMIDYQLTEVPPASRGMGPVLTFGCIIIFAAARILGMQHKMIAVGRKNS